MTYLGASYFESDFKDGALEYVLASDALILGSHGPKIKAPFSLKLGKDCKAVIISDEAVAKNASVECSEGTAPIALYSPGFYEFVLS